MAVQLSAKKEKAYREAFKLFDKNNDGKISTDEIRQACKEVNREVSDDEVQEMKSKYDKDGSGFIEFNEFAQMMLDHDAAIEKNLKCTFDAIDTDGSGFITVDEMDALFKQVGVCLSAEALQQEMAAVDRNADGKICFEEFKKLWEQI